MPEIIQVEIIACIRFKQGATRQLFHLKAVSWRDKGCWKDNSPTLVLHYIDCKSLRDSLSKKAQHDCRSSKTKLALQGRRGSEGVVLASISEVLRFLRGSVHIIYRLKF